MKRKPSNTRSIKTVRNPVWEYEAHLRQIHKELHPHTDWAKPKSLNDASKNMIDETAESFLSNAEPLLQSTKALRKGRIEIVATVDANLNDPKPSKLASMDYSPNGELFMTATQSGNVSLFHIDEESNPLIDTVSIKSFKNIQAGFLPNGEQAKNPFLPFVRSRSFRLDFIDRKSTVSIHALAQS